MKKFIAGFIVGIAFSVALYFSFNPSKGVTVFTGRILDRDTIYLKDGSIVKGWIAKEDNRQIWIETKEGYFTIDRSECQNIQHNTLLLYVRELM